MTFYSFLNVSATLTGVGGSINLGAGASVAEEGLTVAPVSEISTMIIGADGNGEHSGSASTASVVTVRLLKTSPVNAQVQAMVNRQRGVGNVGAGRNTIVIRDAVRGDSITCTGVAFKDQATVNFAKESGMNEWTFNAIKTTTILGTGAPEA